MGFRISSFDLRYGPAGFVLLCLLLVTACQRADDTAPATGDLYEVRVTASTNQFMIGDLVHARVDVTHPTGSRVELPDPSENEHLVVRHRQTATRALDDERVRTTHEYTLTSFQLGTHPVATGAVRFVSTDMDPVTRPYPEVTLTVVSVLGDEDAEPSPIKPLLDWPGRFPRWVPVLVGIAIAALLLGLLAARILSKPRTIMQQAPPRPAHETALNALRLLLSKRYIESGQATPFYTELSSVVRKYLEDRFHLRAPESTTEEFIRDASNARVLTTDHQALVRDFLVQCDLVKFARFQPGALAMKDAYAAAERLILETADNAKKEESP